METWDALRSRRNVRAYTDQPIADDDLNRILEAARRTPSGGNAQHWDLVVVTDRDQLKELSTVWQGAGHVANSAATIAIVLPPPDSEVHRIVDEYDAGQLTYAITLVAADLGIGTGHALVDDQETARRVLGGVPETHRVAWLVALGHPADRPLAPTDNLDRRPFDDVVHRGTW